MTPGYKTTEFWATLTAVVISLLNQGFGLNIPVDVIVTIASSIAAYTLSRGIAKRTGPPAPIIDLSTPAPSVATSALPTKGT